MANANRQFNRIAEAHGLDVVDTVRLAAMINVIAADAAIAFLAPSTTICSGARLTADTLPQPGDPSLIEPGQVRKLGLSCRSKRL